jgi:hypothetical protein
MAARRWFSYRRHGPIAAIARISQMAIAVMSDRRGTAFNRIARSKGDRL